jgi:uncharacterized membrane protein YhaH (DUF805 family)
MDNPYRAPQGQILNPTGGANPTTWKEILFSFQGRIPRRLYWAAFGIQILISIVFNVAIAITGGSDENPGTIGLILAIPVMILSLWIGLAVAVKRWHDRDKSGWWMLINLIPILGWIWAFVENGCLRGTMGPNRFGDDPT